MRPPFLAAVALIAIAVLVPAGAASAVVPDWQPAVTITPSANPAGNITLISTSAGVLVASWVEYDGGEAFTQTASSTDNGVTWSTAMRVSGPGAFDPHVLEMADGTLVISWESLAWPVGELFTSSSSDSGTTWSTPVRVSALGDYSTMHELAASGPNLVATWALGNGGTGVVQASTSTDGGLTWTPPVDVSVPGTPSFNPALIFSGMEAMIIWTHSVPGASTTEVSLSTDGGATWGLPVTISAPPEASLESELLLAPNGTITALWGAWSMTYASLWSATSIDGGATWSPPVRRSIAGQWALTSTTVVTADNQLISTWLYYTDIALPPDPAVSTSTDGGLTWSLPVVVPLPGANAMETTVASAPDGTAVLVVSSIDTVIFSANSLDNGLTWSPIVRLSDPATGAWAPVVVFNPASIAFAAWYGNALQVAAGIAPRALAPALASGGMDAATPLLVAAAFVVGGLLLRARGRRETRTFGQ